MWPVDCCQAVKRTEINQMMPPAAAAVLAREKNTLTKKQNAIVAYMNKGDAR